MIASYLARNDMPKVALLDKPFMWMAMHGYRKAVHPSDASLKALRIHPQNTHLSPQHNNASRNCALRDIIALRG
jgi:hypothetical protein